MQQQNNHIKPVADPELIRRYLAGELDHKAMHALERQALDDPFLAEALEGFEQHAPDQRTNLADLGKRLAQRVQQPAKRRVIPIYMRWAAAAAVCFVVGSSIIWLWPASKQSEIAKVSIKADTIIPAEVPTMVQVPESVTMFKKQQGNYKSFQTPVVTSPPMTTPLAEPQPQADLALAPTPAPAKDTVEEIASQNNLKAEEYRSASAATMALNQVSRFSTYNQNFIQGRVLNLKGDSGIAGVTVTTGGYGVTTDAEGFFSLPAMRKSKKTSGNQLLSAYAPGYESKSLSFSGGEPFVRMQLRRTTDTTTVFSNSGNNDPSPMGGFEKYEIYLIKNVQYPAGLTVSGRVRVQFYVQPDGSLTDFRVLKKLQSECDQEAIRLIKAGPAWLPAANGKAVKVKVDVKFAPEVHQ
ncbi:TonB family protein [Chitinophaga sp.]|uniref:TonB family protein n=1 Tax=Chitinophaga sp. TaxID=1869181 RepID=UPI0031DA5E49